MSEFAVSFCPQLTDARAMGQEFRDAAVLVALTVALPLLLTVPIVYLQASNEAAAFNRLTTGPKVTTWDAFWLDLRVEAR